MKYLDEHPHWFRYDKQHTPAWEHRSGLYTYWHRDIGSYIIRDKSVLGEKVGRQVPATVEVAKDGVFYDIKYPCSKVSDLTDGQYLLLISMLRMADELYPHFSLPSYIDGETLKENQKRKEKFPLRHPWGKNT